MEKGRERKQSEENGEKEKDYHMKGKRERERNDALKMIDSEGGKRK